MPNRINDQEKRTTLATILRSKYFKDSQVTTDLLSYLVDAAVDGHTPKELNIAYDLYKNKNFDPATDSYVRTNVYKLRKKLETYYNHEGAKDEIKLRIPRGHYHVEFEQDLSSSKKLPRLKPLWLFLISSLVINSLLLTLVLLSPKSGTTTKIHKHPFWAELTESSSPTCFAVSNIVMYMEHDEEFARDRWIYDTEVYNQHDLDTLRTNYPHRNLSPVEFSFVHMSNIPNFAQIINIVGNADKNEIKWSQDVDWQDILNKNIIYVGDVRSLNKLAALFDHLYVDVKLPYIVQWVNDKNDTLGVYDITHHKDFRKTYSVITKLRGPKDNIIILILGTGYPARIFTVEQFTQIENLQHMYDKMENILGEMPDYFEMVMQVRSLKRIGYESDILHLRKIEPDEFSWDF